jgi:hypothetical protein
MISKNPNNYFSDTLPRKDSRRISYSYFSKYGKNGVSKYNLYVLPQTKSLYGNIEVNSHLTYDVRYDHYEDTNDYYVNHYTARFFINTFKSVMYHKWDPKVTSYDFYNPRIWEAQLGPYGSKDSYNLSTQIHVLNNFRVNAEITTKAENPSVRQYDKEMVAINVTSMEPECLTNFLQKVYLSIISSTTTNHIEKSIQQSTLAKYSNLCYNWLNKDATSYIFFVNNICHYNREHAHTMVKLIKQKQRGK